MDDRKKMKAVELFIYENTLEAAVHDDLIIYLLQSYKLRPNGVTFFFNLLTRA